MSSFGPAKCGHGKLVSEPCEACRKVDAVDRKKDARIVALRAEIQRKDAALRRYGQHDDNCAFREWWEDGDSDRLRRPCDCGLDAALSSGEGEEGKR